MFGHDTPLSEKKMKTINRKPFYVAARTENNLNSLMSNNKNAKIRLNVFFSSRKNILSLIVLYNFTIVFEGNVENDSLRCECSSCADLEVGSKMLNAVAIYCDCNIKIENEKLTKIIF